MQDKKMKIINIVICYKNVSEVIQYAHQFNDYKKAEMELIIVVNKLSSEQINLMNTELKKIDIVYKIYNPEKNLGYLNGLIYGYRKYVEENGEADWIIMSNTDIQFDPCHYYEYVEKRKYGSNVWCVGPAVYSKFRKSYDNPVAIQRRSKKDLKRLITIFKTPFINVFYIFLSDVKARMFPRDIGKSRNVYEVHGCFFMIRKELGNLLIQNGYPGFLYSEEAYISELVFCNNKKIFYDNQLEIIHLEHSVTGLLQKRKIAKYLSESLQNIFDIFYERE